MGGRNIFIVFGSQGEYSDHQFWPESAHESREDAEEEAKRMRQAGVEWHRRANEIADERYFGTEDGEALALKLRWRTPPGVTYDSEWYDPPTYSVEAVCCGHWWAP